MDFDASAQVDALAKLPPEPPKPAERSAWGWVPRITKAAVAGVAGSVADVVKGAAAADALTLGADPRARGAFTAEQLQAGQVEGQRQIDTGEAMTSTLGDSFRQVQRDARPDPVTAGTAERLVFGVAEPMLKLIGGGLTLGPFGLGAASAEIGLQQSDDLRRQGVDLPTRTAVGALTAGVTAASVALPMVGQTLKSTAGLYVAGGPGGFMAQQAATSEILKRAGYAKIAEQFDPLDPVGLAMSALIPLPFAAYGARNVVRARNAAKAGDVPPVAPVAPEAPTVPREAVDAAMVHNLTLQRQAQEAVPPVARAAEVMRGPVTENPNFKAWFGDSKVVDETGKPLVVYHGTRSGNDFDGFDAARLGTASNGESGPEGFFFTRDSKEAAHYGREASFRADPENYTGGAKGAIYPVYLQMDNPKRVEYGATIQPEVIRQAKAEGYDGVFDERGDIVVFRPEQIKSAIGNSGDFNPASASLTDPRPATTTRPQARPHPRSLGRNHRQRAERTRRLPGIGPDAGSICRIQRTPARRQQPADRIG